jgi:hypothetical protein
LWPAAGWTATKSFVGDLRTRTTCESRSTDAKASAEERPAHSSARIGAARRPHFDGDALMDLGWFVIETDEQ